MSEKYYFEGNTGPWELIVGLEVHAQVSSQAKLFSGAPTAFGAEPNTQVAFVDAAMPGMLPVINRLCVEQAVKTGFGLNAEINLVSIFDRKNYFYADLPSGYQISQFQKPIVGKGHLDIELEDGSTRRIGVTRLHLEQDAGKSFHDQHPEKSYIDLNRAGVALMEIVSEPDIRSPEEAAAYVKKLRAIVRALGTCDGNMDQGSMRVDVNVSVRKPGAEMGTRAEIKNVNSVKFITQAIVFEATRQIEILEDGGQIVQETRLFDSNKGITRSMRSKEDAHDYRYFPDPDLPPLVIEAAWVEEIRKNLPELPDAKKARLMTSYDLPAYDASLLVSEAEIASYFESTLKFSNAQDAKTAKMISNWMLGELFATLNRENKTISESPITPEKLAGLIQEMNNGTISGKMAKDVFLLMWETSKTAPEIIEEKGLKQVSDNGVILAVIDKVMAENPQMVEDFKSGKDKLFGFFVGQVMKGMQGKGNPGLINDLLKERLK
ncbi:Aspartyl/glutamyl-tRNA amidotransferase subunit B [Candidatus Bealeia paramacronuclearis]|uniref:Aspartyl/glutamyl-tRNA(Asn/Gln) amidotransferase subunit B n=1 Tax=Candidatus Bealeia paramacronuclearis TaxID=1921001 RepID=A0ABZ2C164_9PROT|nr:Aspartyl/glutamyl-tRNA amidotransferase subunit B [Candidatus Bealeia paramacronuclearis]